jgi:hypothetical protein
LCLLPDGDNERDDGQTPFQGQRERIHIKGKQEEEDMSRKKYFSSRKAVKEEEEGGEFIQS